MSESNIVLITYSTTYSFGSPGIVVETVAQAFSLHGQAARPAMMAEKQTT